jgi:hypothetical protein
MSQTWRNFAMVFVSVLITGCRGGSGKQAAPPGAVMEVERAGGLAYVARGPGMLYIQNARTGKMIFTTPVRALDKVIFFPERNQILINGNAVHEADLNEKHVHRIYFAKSP